MTELCRDLESKRLRLAIAGYNPGAPSETFIRSHITALCSAFEVQVLYGDTWTLVDAAGRSLLPGGRYIGGVLRRLSPAINQSIYAHALACALRRMRVDAVVAEYGPIGVSLLDAARQARLPLFVFFRGFDASIRSVLDAHSEGYQRLFHYAAGIFCVSRSILHRLQALGAPADRLHLNPSGIDPRLFYGALPETMPPKFLAVGRMVEKKAPYLTVLSFEQVARTYPDARLTIIGEGPLLGPTKRMANALGLRDRVTFLGAQPTEKVSQQMRESRAFVQHSLEAEDGDSEGTPNSIMEAQMSGLPVVSTTHAGIPDVVIDEETGFLVPEGAAHEMGERMLRLARDPALAGAMGRRARENALRHCTLDRHIRTLVEVISQRVAVPL